jgi:hypothetical protein
MLKNKIQLFLTTVLICVHGDVHVSGVNTGMQKKSSSSNQLWFVFYFFIVTYVFHKYYFLNFYEHLNIFEHVGDLGCLYFVFKRLFFSRVAKVHFMFNFICTLFVIIMIL